MRGTSIKPHASRQARRANAIPSRPAVTQTKRLYHSTGWPSESIICPRGRPSCATHQCLGGELRRFSAIDDGRGDVGRQPGKTQEGNRGSAADSSSRAEIMHGQLGVLDQTRLDVVSARDMILSELGSAAVWSSPFSTSIRISRPTRFRPTGHRQSQKIIRRTRRRLMLHLQIKRPGEQLVQAASRERDVDAKSQIFAPQSQGPALDLI